MPEDWISVSITRTRCPCKARTAARFAVVFDLPVPPRKEWMDMTLGIKMLPQARQTTILRSSGLERQGILQFKGTYYKLRMKNSLEAAEK
jgi:hypothetical protein